MSITSVTPSRLSPITEGPLVIIGSGFTGQTGGTIEGRAMTDFVVISDTEIRANWPRRIDNGRLNFAQSDVTLQIGAMSATVTYTAPVNLRCVQNLENTLAAATTANGYYFEWSQPQVIRGKFDISTRAANGQWPIGVVWMEDESFIDSESTGNLRVYDLPVGIGALVPLADNLEPNAHAALLTADLVRAAYLDISQGQNALSTDVIAKNYAVYPAESGMLLGVDIRLVIRYQHIAQDSTQEVFWQNTQF